ncbi:MAG TPA: DUF222 domain-containing protein [Jatrophihabitantaceae bacterium]|nr:DUF222 domain-containing protein [Jatrophihabitantaceae bacterium]
MHESVWTAGTGTAALTGLIAALRHLPADADDAVLIDQIRLLEELKSAAAATQARLTARFAASQRQAQRDAGVPAERADRGIASQIGLARRVSHFQARRYVGWAKILTTELPATFAQLQAGKTSEWRAMLVARETAWLSREHRATVDAELAPKLEPLGDKRVETEAKKAAYRIDPTGFVNRLSNSANDRRVSLRPAPDAMTRLTALLPVAQGVAVYAALGRAADTNIASGDERGRGQVMADTLVERVTGQAAAEQVPVEVNLVIDTDTLLAEGTEPALIGGVPIPAATARELALRPDAPRWLRRLYTHPDTGELVAMDSRRRLFTPGQRKFIALRDQVCRTPWCEAPIRHTDHTHPAARGGKTSIDNGGGLCVACNIAKQAPGWHARPGPAGIIDIFTPTGHRYTSRPPALPRSRQKHSPVEQRFAEYLREARKAVHAA